MHWNRWQAVQELKDLSKRQTSIRENWKSKIEEFTGHIGCTSGLNIWALIYLNFISDLPGTVFNSKVFLFADELKLLNKINIGNAHESRKDLDSTLRWSNEYNISVNLSKYQYINFKIKSRLISGLNNRELRRTLESL